MTSLDELLQKQMQTMRSIDRALINFKKLGQAKMTAATVHNRMAMLKDAYRESKDLDAMIAACTDAKTHSTLPYFAESCFVQSEERYQEALDHMAEVLAKVTPTQAAPNVSSNSTTLPPTVHLPRIQLPSFDGAFAEWETFRDRFSSMVINNQSLSNVERLHFLYSSLSGEASHAVSHLPVTENNFEIAWKTLTSRYENKHRLISTHLNNLFSLPAVMSETPDDLRSLRDNMNISLQMLRNLNRPVDAWSDMIVFIGVQKLDRASRKAWEFQIGDSTEFPTYEQFDAFLEKRIRALDSMPTIHRDTSEKIKPAKPKALSIHSTTAVKIACSVCKQGHLLFQCPTFLSKTPSERFNIVKQQNRCVNCFSSKHSASQCQNSHQCKECRQRHHTLLHFPAQRDVAHCATRLTTTASNNGVEVSSNLASETPIKSSVLLCTARVRVHSLHGRCVQARALLDQGSSGTLITEHLAQSLRLERTKQSTHVTGIGDTDSYASHVAALIITPSETNEPAYTTNVIIMTSLTRYVPPRSSAYFKCPHLAGLNLADKEPMSTDPIDLIIGADLYGQLLLQGVRKGPACTPTAQNTALGWILSGPIHHDPTAPATHVHHATVLENLDETLKRFWVIEDLPCSPPLSPEDKKCEAHFKTTHSRKSDGRYTVRLPFKTERPRDLGDSRFKALKSLRGLEHRLSRDPTISQAYRDFLSEYESLDHMSRTNPSASPLTPTYYIPHHAVLRHTSATTRLRVVFNASCRSSNGISLNDLLLTGPKLQQDLQAILIRWRRFQYVYTADIAKMYRQILVDDRDRDYQRILWRDSPSKPIEEYRLNTVTYGTTPAPYLALRVLKQLVEDEGSNFPAAVSVINNQAYVDDFLFGDNSIPTLRHIRDQTIQLLAKGGFSLRKWASNDPTLLSDVNPDDHGLATSKSLDTNETISILGLIWNPRLDQFNFKVSLPSEISRTKRTILSTIAKLFDPMGWVTPVTISAKIFIQRLWSLRIDWDDVVPATVLTEWREFYTQLRGLERLSIPRKLSPMIPQSQTFHGFSDASSTAYAAAVYSRSVHYDGSVCVQLILAKSRVAPVKTITIPRLELCAALLLARLLNFVCTTVKAQLADCHCWTDSTITLTWLTQPPTRWKTFVANRVTKIQNLIPNVQWHHVPTKDNPADCASRGISVQRLESYQLWWSGPNWLLESQEDWPREPSSVHPEALHEAKPGTAQCLLTCRDKWTLSERYSSWPKLLRVTAYILRFLQKLRNRRTNQKIESLTVLKQAEVAPMALKPDEIQRAKTFWLKRIQQETFPEELKSLAASKPLPRSSQLLPLAPYLDQQGLIRAKGRLAKSQLPENAKTPIVLRSHPLLSLLIRHTHLKLLHAGPNLTLACLRTEYWILRARATVRAVLYKCVACTRERSTVPSELMGDLPAPRVTQSERPFIHTGVDYAGPIQIRTAPGRGRKSHKAYIAVFVCLTVKAIHIELVSDYSAAAFVAAYHRFSSRRGLPRAMYSDNGTTFQGANRELAHAHRSAIQNPDFQNQLATDCVVWHFMPPNAPHFGGLWEAAVKSIKHHLKRSIGAHTLTYEEMYTILCRIEACLNSRPIGATSECLDDYTALTPGHFLIGMPIVSQPESSVLNVRDNRLSRWQLVQKITESFWKAWSNDYLHTLQQRPKWETAQNLAKVGQLVAIRNPNMPPSKWELGRIIACHQGDDNIVRVVTVKTAHSEYKRPITRLCFLPVAINDETDAESRNGTAGDAS